MNNLDQEPLLLPASFNPLPDPSRPLPASLDKPAQSQYFSVISKTLTTANHLKTYKGDGSHNHPEFQSENGELRLTEKGEQFSQNSKSINVVVISAIMLVWIIVLVAI